MRSDELECGDKAAFGLIAPWNARARLISLWDMLRQYMTPVAAIVAHKLDMFAFLEGQMKDWDGKRDVDDNMVRENQPALR
jgi:hypothetical protein